MRGNIFGNLFAVTNFGESHGQPLRRAADFDEISGFF